MNIPCDPAILFLGHIRKKISRMCLRRHMENTKCMKIENIWMHSVIEWQDGMWEHAYQLHTWKQKIRNFFSINKRMVHYLKYVCVLKYYPTVTINDLELYASTWTILFFLWGWIHFKIFKLSSVQFSCSVVSDCSTPGLPVHHQLLEFT